MAFKTKSNVCEISTTSGTADYLLSGAIDTFDTFGFLDNGDTTYFHAKATDASGLWEEGIATKETGGLERTTIFDGSNGTSKVDWPDTSPKRIVCGMPARRGLGWEPIKLHRGAASQYNTIDLAGFLAVRFTGTMIPSADATLRGRVSTDNGSTYVSSSNSYYRQLLLGTSSSASSSQSTTETAFTPGASVDAGHPNAAGSRINVTLFDLNVATLSTMLEGHVRQLNDAGTGFYVVEAFGMRAAAELNNAVRWDFDNSATIMAGSWLFVEGLRG